MKKVAVLQSNYIPWKGYFDIIHDVDEFIFYDDVQYTNRDWRNRNLVYTSSGLKWLSIPCGSNRDNLIHEVQIINTSGWAADHWNKICESYKKAPYFNQYRDFVEEIYLGKHWERLSDFNQYFIKTISKEILGIETVFTDSRSYQTHGVKHERLLSLARAAGADCYLSGPAAKDYIIEKDYVNAGIHLIWKDYTGYPIYKQIFTPFEHGVTILDLIFNTGPNCPYYIWGWRNK